MKAINIRTAPLDWKSDPAYVYCGRAGRGHTGELGNPVAIGRKCLVCDEIHMVAGDTLPCYETYLRKRLGSDSEFANLFDAIPEHATLVCFCKPKPCHIDIIMKVWQERHQ